VECTARIVPRVIPFRECTGTQRPNDGGDRLLDAGFLGTEAPRAADLTLLLEIAMAGGLFVGTLLARARRFQLHALCQSVIVLLNLVLIVLAMFPSFHRQVSPRLPGKIGKPYYALAAAHAASGFIAELGGLYILVAAGTNLLPEKIRITRYKFWMRSVLSAWCFVLILGLATYARWYVAHATHK
jgi:uncharacterized membrane protein YozB (DUF420 family)